MNNTIKLYTVQPICVYNQLIRDKVFIADPIQSSFYHPDNEDDENFVRAYDWLIKEMKTRLPKKPRDAKIPIWGWYRYCGENKLDLRRYGKVKKPYCVLEIDKPKNEVLLSDFTDWHNVLNDYYLPQNGPDDEIEKLCDEYDQLVIHNPKKAKALKLESWRNVFNIEPNEYDSKEYIQGTFWTLDIDEVRKVRKYL